MPYVLAIAPHMVRHPDRYGRGPGLPPPTETLMGQDKIVEIHKEPDPASMSRHTGRPTAGAATQRRAQAPERPIPAFHEGGLDGCAQASFGQLPEEPAGAPKDHAHDDLDQGAGGIADFHDLRVKQVSGGYQDRLRMTPAGPAAPQERAAHGQGRVQPLNAIPPEFRVHLVHLPPSTLRSRTTCS